MQCSAARSSLHSGIVFTTSSKLSIVDCGAVHYREKLLRMYDTAVLMKHLCALLRCPSVAIVLYYLAHELCVAQRMPWQAATCLQRWIAGEPDVKQERHSTDEKWKSYMMMMIENS